MINFYGVKLLDNSPMIEVFMNFILTDSMLYVVIFYLLGPTVVEMMNFASNFFTTF
mgnify:CR=1 FL=1